MHVEVEPREVGQVELRDQLDLVPQHQAIETPAQVDPDAALRVERAPPRTERAVVEGEVALVVVLALEVTEVVKFEGAPREVLPGAPKPVCAAFLADVQRSAGGERAGLDRPPVRLPARWPILQRGGDRLRHRRVIAGGRTPASVAAEHVSVVRAAPVRGGDACRRADRTGGQRGLEAVDGGRQRPDLGIGGDLALHARNVEHGPRIQVPCLAHPIVFDLDVVRAGERGDEAHGGARPDGPDQLGGPVERRRLRVGDQRLARHQGRRRRLAPDAPGVHQRPHRREDVDPLQKERALLRERHLVGRQVEDHRVGLDLTEVGVDRQVQGQLVGDVRARVETGRARGGPTVREGGVRVRAAVADAPEREWPQLDRVPRRQVAQVVQPAEQRYVGRGAARVERPVVGLLARVDEAPHLEAPVLHGQRGEAQHRKRNAELDGVAAL